MHFILTFFQIFIWLCLPVESWGSTKSDFQINDKIYVISTSRTSNKEDSFLETALKNYRIKFSKYNTIDEQSIVFFNSNTNKIISKKMLASADLTTFHNPMFCITAPQITDTGITYHIDKTILSQEHFSKILTHRAIWTDIIKNKYSRAIIFEDSIKLEKDFDKNFSIILKNLPRQFDVFFLDICLFKIGNEKTFFYPPSFWLSNFSNTTSSYYARVKHTNQIGGLHAYIVTYQSAKKLLDLTTTISMPLDKTVILSNLNLFVSKTKLLSRKAITKRIQP